MKKGLLVLMLLSAVACMGMKENQAAVFPSQKITVAVTVPDSGWRVRIMEVHRVEESLWVFSELAHLKGQSSQVISTVKDSIEIAAPSLPVVHFIIGKTWNWTDKKDSNRYIVSREDIAHDFQKGECLYQKKD